jgi:outer membrane protein TolC
VVGFATPAVAQRRQMLLTLREATAFALRNNLEIQIAGLSPRIREAKVTEERGIFDVEGKSAFTLADDQTLSTSTRFDVNPEVGIEKDDAGDIIAANAGQQDTQTQEGSLGVEQLTPFGGTYEITLSGSHIKTNEGLISNLPGHNIAERSADRADLYTAEIELKVTQPILRDFGRQVTANAILIAQNDFTISQEAFRQQIIASTSQVQRTYWDLKFRRQDLEVREQQLALAQRLLTQVRRQVEVGTQAPIEVLQAETEIARVKELIITAENAVRNAEDQLKRVMHFSLAGEFADVELLPTDAPSYRVPTLNQTDEIRQALENRLDISQAKLALENQQITLVLNKNRLLPTLDFEASLSLNGIDDSMGGAFGEIDADRYRWDLGLVFKYPIANRQAKSRYQQTQLAIRQQLLRIKNIEERIMEDVRAAVRSVLATSQLVHATRAASRLAEKQLEAEEKKLQVGLATVFTVLQFQEDLAVERSNEIKALTDYSKALIRLEEVKNTLLQSYNIILESTGPSLR